LFFISAASAADIPSLEGYVTDQAGLISSEMKVKLEAYLKDFEKSDSIQIFILTIPSLEGKTLEEYSIEVAETWKGQTDKDNGVLLLVTRDDRQAWVEAGYGLKSILTDLLAGRIINDEIIPRLKEGKFEEGIAAGLGGIVAIVRGEYKGEPETVSSMARVMVILIITVALMARTAFRNRKFSRDSRDGFFSGGRGGFSDDDRFGGGGTSGRWR